MIEFIVLNLSCLLGGFLQIYKHIIYKLNNLTCGIFKQMVVQAGVKNLSPEDFFV